VKSVEMNVEKVCDDECCSFKHLSKLKLSVKEKLEILNYFKSMKNRNQQNEYLKSLVKPIEILQRTTSNSKRNINFEYFINWNDKSNHNIQTLNKVCKTAFLKLHQIKDSRLRRKIKTNRDETEIKTGKHDSRPNKIPLEVEMDIREFIENYPSRERVTIVKLLKQGENTWVLIKIFLFYMKNSFKNMLNIRFM